MENMEKIVDSRIRFVDHPFFNVKFEIFYPCIKEIEENQGNLEDFKEKIVILERIIQEKTEKLFEFSKDFEEVKRINENILFELDEKNVEIEELRDLNQKLKDQNENLQKLVDELVLAKENKTNQCNKLQKTLHDIKANRKTAEVLLEKQEGMNKELIEKNVKLEKALLDAEKKNAENAKMVQRLKDEINGTNDNNKQRDETLKAIVKKIKFLETEKLKLLEEIRKRDESIKKLQSATKDPQELPSHRPKDSKDSKDLKKVMDLLQIKDNEIKMMKDMIKAFQTKSQKSPNPTTQKSLKLPPISGDPKKKSNISVKFQDTSQNSLNSLERVESFVSGRKPTPGAPRRNFKSLFSSNEEGSHSPSFSHSPGLQSPKFEDPEKYETRENQEKEKFNHSNERRTRGKVKKINENYKEINENYKEINENFKEINENFKEIPQRRFDFEEKEFNPKKRVSFRDDFKNEEKFPEYPSEKELPSTRVFNEKTSSNLSFEEASYTEDFIEEI